MISRELLLKGLRHPHHVPEYLIGRLFPSSSIGPNWRREDGIITFATGGFAGGSPSRPALCARIHREATQIDRLLGDREYDSALEVGCGYGRMTGWIASHAGDLTAVEPNERALAAARRLYPEVDFTATSADSLPYSSDDFDLVVSWAVLGHVPPEAIEPTAREIRRVLDGTGTLLLCEKTRGESGSAAWVRSPEEYEALFAPFRVVESETRSTEPGFDHARKMEAMRLERPE